MGEKFMLCQYYGEWITAAFGVDTGIRQIYSSHAAIQPILGVFRYK